MTLLHKINAFADLKKRFIKSETGVAAIEFALVLPVLLILLLSSVELYTFVNAKRKIAGLATTLADLVTQSTEVSEADLSALAPLIETYMGSMDPSTVRYRIASIHQGGSGTEPQLRWEHINGSTKSDGDVIVGGSKYKKAKCGIYSNAEGTTFPPNISSIFVLVEYTYTAGLSQQITGPIEVKEKMVAIPRASDIVSLTDTPDCVGAG